MAVLVHLLIVYGSFHTTTQSTSCRQEDMAQKIFIICSFMKKACHLLV